MDKPRQKADLIIANCAEVITCAKDAPDLVGKILDGWIAASGERILAVGSRESVLAAVDADAATVIDAANRVVVPGFVDSHTHLVFGGSRVREYAARMTVDDDEQLHQMGIATGIMVSVGMTRSAGEQELYFAAKDRLRQMLEAGTTTVESKSGYGLTTTEEIKMLRVNAQLAGELPVDIASTFLGAHGWPPNLTKDVYISILLEEMIPWVSNLGLAEYCDVWCDDGHFTAHDSARILDAAAQRGLRPKIHTDAYSYIGGSDLAAEMAMVSADHLNYTPRPVMRKLAQAGVTGVLLPALDFAVRHPQPFNVRAMLDEGMTLALATNLCPGCWVQSMQFVLALACRQYRMSPAEALRAATLGGAKALGLEDDRGSLEVGKLADIQIWGVPAFENVIYRLGGNVVEKVIKRGKLVVDTAARECGPSIQGGGL